MSMLQRALNRTGYAMRKGTDLTVGSVDGSIKGWLTTGRVALVAGYRGHKVNFKDSTKAQSFQDKVDAYIKAHPDC